MKTKLSKKQIKSKFHEKIASISGEKVLACYQCGKCTAGCPVADQMDIPPNQIIRYIQLGMEKELLESNSMWLCASCLTCSSRCPKGIDIAKLIEATRQVLLRKNIDHLKVTKLTDKTKEELPPIALISNLRKTTS